MEQCPAITIRDLTLAQSKVHFFLSFHLSLASSRTLGCDRYQFKGSRRCCLWTVVWQEHFAELALQLLASWVCAETAACFLLYQWAA